MNRLAVIGWRMGSRPRLFRALTDTRIAILILIYLDLFWARLEPHGDQAKILDNVSRKDSETS